MFATGETVGLAEWIIDDTCLVFCLCKNISYHKWLVYEKDASVAFYNQLNIWIYIPV